MRTLRRRAVAKVAGMKYEVCKCGGYDLKDIYGSIGSCLVRPNDKEYMDLVKFNKS